MKIVLDSSAVLAYLWQEPGGELVRAAILDPANVCLLHAINACEVFYQTARAGGEELAEKVLDALAAAGIDTREDLDAALWQDAGRIKARGRIALADCLAVALARREGAELVTADRAELEPVADAGLCKVRFIR